MRIISLCLCLLILLCGCVNTPVADPTQIPETTIAENTAETTTEIATEATTEETVPENRQDLIDTPYYSLTIPENWADHYAYSVFENGDGAYTLRICEKSSMEEYGGKLFTILLIPETEDYTYYPSYNPLGSIETAEYGSFNVVVLYPTDVQFSMEAAELYMSMEQDIPDILNSITYHDCVFADEPIPAPTPEQ